LPTLSNCPGSNLTAYTAATPCTNNNLSLSGNNTITLSGGVYFISGPLQLKGSTSITGTATFILLPGASFDMRGTGTINLTANSSVTTAQLPAALQPYISLFGNMAIYDLDSSAVTFGGNSNITFNGNMYLPNTAVTFQGNPTVGACGELIAASVAFNGNATFDNSGCSANTRPNGQVVMLVQ
jgi:hypothetical protein